VFPLDFRGHVSTILKKIHKKESEKTGTQLFLILHTIYRKYTQKKIKLGIK